MAPKTIDLEFVKHELKKQANGDIVATYEMKKPSDLRSGHQPSELPKVRLNVKGNGFMFSVMMRIHHKNILRLEGIQEISVGDDKLLGVFVEQHVGPLIAYLKHLVADKVTRVLPSQAFRDLVRQIIDGLEELRVNGLYHGAVSIQNIFYFLDGRAIIVKLANFWELLDTELKMAQLLDWVGLGHVLAYIANAARRLNNNFSCAMIDHLASKLQGLTDTEKLPNLKEETLADPFFWGTRKRTNFYIHDIQEALEDDIFVQRVIAYMHWHLPWDSNPHDGLVAAMNDYRKTELHQDPYKPMDPIDNIKCMCGAYTHQDKLKGKIKDSKGNLLSVDAAIQKNQPDLCLTLYRLLTGEIAAEEAAAAAAEEAAVAAAAVDAEMNEDDMN